MIRKEAVLFGALLLSAPQSALALQGWCQQTHGTQNFSFSGSWSCTTYSGQFCCEPNYYCDGTMTSCSDGVGNYRFENDLTCY